MSHTLEFTKEFYLQSEKDAIEFVFVYDIQKENSDILKAYKIKVSISGALAASWGFQMWSPNADKDYVNLKKILYQYAKKEIIRNFKNEILQESDEVVLLSTNAPSEPPYKIEELPELLNKKVEF